MFIEVSQETEKYNRVHYINLFEIITVECLINKEDFSESYMIYLRDNRRIALKEKDFLKVKNFIENK